MVFNKNNKKNAANSELVKRFLESKGLKTIEELIDYLINCYNHEELIKHGLSQLLRVLASNPKIEMRSGMFSGEVNTHLVSDDCDNELSFSSLSSLLSLPQRFKSNITNKSTPFEFLNKNFAVMIKTILGLIPLEEFEKDPLNYIVQYLHEERLLVNSFDIQRVFLFMRSNVLSAVEKITSHEPVQDILSCFAILDPSAGWGCRYTATTTIHLYLLRLMKESSLYSEDEIEQFANSVSYIGYDTNTEMLPIYERIKSLFAQPEFGIGDTARFVMLDFNGVEGNQKLVDLFGEHPYIKTAFTSSPTVLEIYPHYDESLNEAGIKSTGRNSHDCTNWLMFVEEFLLKIYSVVGRLTSVERFLNFIDDCTITQYSRGKPTRIKAEVATQLVHYLNDMKGSYIEDVRTDHIAWDCICPKKLTECESCIANQATDCEKCSECIKGFGCPHRVNPCDECSKTASGMRTIVVVEFVR